MGLNLSLCYGRARPAQLQIREVGGFDRETCREQ
jgi:hypothetical protein